MPPRATRPHMPGYGIAEGAEGLLPWSWAVERLEASRNYWISTTSTSGRPHAMPVWGLWLDDALHFSTGEDSKKARNLRASPACVATTESAAEAVIVEGEALPQDTAQHDTVLAAYAAKYGWSDDPGGWLTLRPIRAFGFIEDASRFGQAATRWLFD